MLCMGRSLFFAIEKRKAEHKNYILSKNVDENLNFVSLTIDLKWK